MITLQQLFQRPVVIPKDCSTSLCITPSTTTEQEIDAPQLLGNNEEESSSESSNPIAEKQPEEESLLLQTGDHIYSWRAAGTWNHHGIVLAVSPAVVIVDFFPASRTDDSSTAPRIQLRSLEEWKAAYGKPFKVLYKAGPLRRFVRRSGTCTSRESEPAFLVLGRVTFLLETLNSENCYLPPYHRLHSNSETAAFWCKTGHWATLQVADFLHLTFAGQIKSSLTLGAYVTAQAITDPVSGAVGVTMGATTSFPVLLPLVVGYGLITVGGPLWMLRQCESQWNSTTLCLHEAFWSVAPNEVLVNCIQHWTNLVDCDSDHAK